MSARCNHPTITSLPLAETYRPTGTFSFIVYHLYMRPLHFVLMIALLLLRGWTGEAMATGMALTPLQQPQSATTIIATHAHGMSQEEHFHPDSVAPERHHQAQALHDCAAHPSEDASPAADAHCDSCAACHACHAMVLAPAAGDSSPVFSSLLLPRAAAAQFSSAVAARGQKPPIS